MNAPIGMLCPASRRFEYHSVRPGRTIDDTSESESTQTSGKVWRILIIDDNAECARSLAILLELLGYDVETSGDGIAAIAAAERYRPDVILLDLVLPKLDGYDTLTAIRDKPWGKEIAVFAATGLAQAAGFGTDSSTHPAKQLDMDALLQQVLEMSRSR